MTRRLRIEEMERLLRSLADSPLAEPPGPTLRRARALGAHLPRPDATGNWIIRMLADTLLDPLPAGVRSAAGGERRMLLAAGSGSLEREIDLLFLPDPAGRIRILGQVLPTAPGLRVEVRSGRSVRRAEPGEGGDFAIGALPARSRSFSLRIEEPGVADLVLADLPLPRDRE